MSKYYGTAPNGRKLKHYNIKGSHWGVRRFQNEDGSLTAAGRARYGYTDSGTGQEVNRLQQMSGKTNPQSQKRPLSSVGIYDTVSTIDNRYDPKIHTNVVARKVIFPTDEVSRAVSSTPTSSMSQTTVDYGQEVADQVVSQTAKVKVSKLRSKKPVRRMTTSSNRNLNEKTKNLTDLMKNQPYLRNKYKD